MHKILSEGTFSRVVAHMQRCTTRFATYKMGSKVHGHNVMRHLLALLSMLSDLYPLIISPIRAPDQSEKKGTSTYKCNYDLCFKMGPSKFSMSLFSWIWRDCALF